MKHRKVLVIALLVVLALAAAACGKSGKSTTNDSGGTKNKPLSYKVQALPNLKGTAAKLAQAGTITIGVKSDQPGLGFKDPTTGQYSGFDIEIARMIAADLGIAPSKIIFKEIPSKNREIAISNGEVDLYVGTYTINDARKQQVSFAGPYFVAGQDLLVKKGNNTIKGPQDLAGKNVCSATGSTPIQRIKSNYPQAKTTEFDVYSKCVDKLRDGEVDAVTTDNAILAGYAAQEPNVFKVVGKPFSTEPYGVGLKHDDVDLQNFVATSLKHHEDNGDYTKAFDATLGKSGIKMPPIPKITEGVPQS